MRELLEEAFYYCRHEMPAWLLNKIEAELEKPEPKPEPIGFINPLHLENGFYSARVWKERGCNGINTPVYAEPPKRKPLSDEEFLKWILKHKDNLHALNYAELVNKPGEISRKWKLQGWVKKLKAVIEEFYGINASVYTHPPDNQNPLSDNQIREIMMANGFRIQDGFDDLKPYVFKAVRAIEQAHGIK